MKIMLDTDIGTDIDDALALALILVSPELELLGVTCVYGDTVLRARMARKLLNLRGRQDVPVFAGTTPPVMGLRPVYWGGHEGVGLLSDEDYPTLTIEPQFAAEWIVRTARQYPGEVQLIAIAPLTNIALALILEPNLPKLLRGVTMMGGVVRGSDDLHLPFAEHNILCDPDAAHVVFSSGLPITLTPLNFTVQTRVTKEMHRRIEAAGTPFHLAIADQLARYPRFQAYGFTSPHDPLAVTTLLRPDLFEFVTVDVVVESAGRVGNGAIFPVASAQGSVKLMRSLNVPAFEEFLAARLES